jgi:dTDP-4-amino-4,6-dideoxygalactose transaminase
VEGEEMIKLSKASIGESEKKAVMGVLDREYLGMGGEVQEFERRLGEFFGRPAVCVVNGTAAIHLACQAAGLGPGDEVLIQSLTYVASFQAISATGAIPVPCDIDSETVTLDWRDAEKRVTKKTKAVMPVHYGSGVGDLDGMYEFARRHGLKVIEDAAQAFGTTYKGKKVGSFGDIACFSFDGIKNITAGEGGCVVTEDEEVLRRLRDGRLLGVERDTERRYRGERSWSFDVSAQGWRYHMSNLMAAIGTAQLDRFPEFARRRQALARHYDALLAGDARIRPISRDADAVVPHIYVVRIDGLTDREALRDGLLKAGIQTGVHYMPNHLLSFYRRSETLPATEAVFPELVTLPLHADLTEADVKLVCDTLRSLLQ